MATVTCPDCTTGGFLPGEPTNSIQSNGAYYAPSPTPNSNTSDNAIILLTDGFGLALKNSKVLADKLAERLGCDVWVPDYFAGRPIVPLDAFHLVPDRAGVKMTTWDWIKWIFATIPYIPTMIASRPSVVDARIQQFIKGIVAERGYKRFGAIGYCYGGSAMIRLASTGLVHSAVICHPGPFTTTEVEAIKVPAAWTCAEDDMFFSKASRLDTEAIFAKRQGRDDFVPYEFVDYKGTAHGFASRPNLTLPEVKEAHERAFEQAVAWFTKTLKS